MILNNVFISNEELSTLISNTTSESTKNILKDFQNFTIEITKQFKDNVQFEKYDLMYDFLFMESGIDNSYLEKINSPKYEKNML